jgi:hypothetical protein
MQNKKPSRPVPRPKPADAWLAENRQALESSNAFVEAHGLPLELYRKVLRRRADKSKAVEVDIDSLLAP